MSHTRVHRRQPISGISNKRALLPVWIICSFMLALVVAGFIKLYLDGRPRSSDVAAVSLGPAKDLAVSISSLSRQSIHLYTIKSSEQELRFIVQRTNNNVLRVGAATCRVCRRSSQLHYAHEGVFYCGQCREEMHFEGHGPSSREGCSMPEIPHSETEGVLLVRASDVKATYDKALR